MGEMIKDMKTYTNSTSRVVARVEIKLTVFL
jgi:hypothetical protein